jgi:hypothetical protein
MIDNNHPNNPWTPQDEGDHYPVMKEWWTIETLFKTLEDNRKWNLKVIMAYKMETPSCFFQYALFDITSKKCILRADIDDDIERLSHKKNKLDLQYEKSTISGLYPNYHIHIDNEKQGFAADMKYKAKSLPHWVAQDITNGNLPFGWNFYKYGFIPNCDLSGTLNIKNKSYNIEGKGYLEHVWGEWSYQNPFQKLSDLKKTISTYVNLGKWWLSQHKPCIPKSISFTTENNIFGYDWVWGVFDNDWSLFYGNSMFWISEGPAFGVLSITPDGKNYWEFCNVTFHYNKLIYIKKYDAYFPCDLELTGVLGDRKIHLRFWLTTESYEYIDNFKNDRFYKAFILCEMPGRMEGVYTDCKKNVKLKGDCKMMPLRQPSVLGHNSLRFDFLLPPKGVGIDVDLNSHYLKKRVTTRTRFAPHLDFKFNIKKLKDEDFSSYK